MYKDLKRTCTAIVSLIKPFVWQRSRCRRRRGLLQFPITDQTHGNTESIFFLHNKDTKKVYDGIYAPVLQLISKTQSQLKSENNSTQYIMGI